MKKDKILCDRCTREIGEGARRGVTLSRLISREPDPSGNGYQTNTEALDICEPCLQGIFEALWDENLITNRFSLTLRSGKE